MSKYTEKEKQALLKIADDSIKYGLKNNKLLQIDVSSFPKNLQKNAASFVTLEIKGNLKGCIGTLKAYQPLVQDVAKNSYAAAFKDTRFDPVTIGEYSKLTKQISILSRPIKMSFTSEKDLLQKLHPGIDGLILSDKGHEGTFLPSVWKELQEPKLFLQQLKVKAGLPEKYWSKTLKVKRYTVEVIE